MIIADTSIWVDHFRKNEVFFGKLLEARQIVLHPFVLGEVSLGNLSQRPLSLSFLQALPKLIVASNAEVQALIEERSLFGRGIGYVDCHLLAASLLNSIRLWTRDKRLHKVAVEMGIAV
jgi:predicted nucleic acid-binding protein